MSATESPDDPHDETPSQPPPSSAELRRLADELGAQIHEHLEQLRPEK